ncbi:DUF3274 domain-containing protein [Iodobacter sp.]|uniref:T6SS effector phospholipase Tle3 domain-containing protein n=1 Tax=Iodobacter sp. TaxID=1915058 RepID=UPI0025FF45B1|nr:DUF3274 domain-containing protein [Iodobacter sp.]
MTTESTEAPSIGSSSALLMPNRYKDHPVQTQRNMPGVVILVHGVNDMGVSYAAQDIGLCAGLNERLDRPDLFPNDFRLPSDDDKAVEDPDAIYFRRIKNDKTNSPVIHFHWGYKATDKELAKEKINEQVVDKFGNRLDKQNAKGGGMFSNATSSIPEMFHGAFKGGFLVWLTNNLIADKIHIVTQAPDRHYMALAAKRLAALITQIRAIDPNETVTVVGHSQGCLVALAAQAFLKKEGKRSADCLIMCHPPYGLHEPWLDRATQTGDAQETTKARIETLVKLVELITDNPHPLPPLQELKDSAFSLGRAGDAWSPTQGKRASVNGDARILDQVFFERDNRGKVYLYFCPHDMTVGLANVQGIGTLGVPDKLEGKEPVLERLGPRFLQRVWTWRKRDGKSVAVGAAPGPFVMRIKGEAAYDGGMFETAGRTGLQVGETRSNNGEALNPPWVPDLHQGEDDEESKEKAAKAGGPAHIGNLRIDPIDACDAVVKAGVKYLPEEKRKETPTEARQRYQGGEAVPNSYHSSIVGNFEHHRWVTAMDVAIGQAKCMDDPDWRDLLLAMADWRTMFDPARNVPTFKKYSNLEEDVRKVLEANYRYYKEAVFPDENMVPRKPPSPIFSETRSARAAGSKS